MGALVGSLLWTWRPALPARAAPVVMASLAGVAVPIGVAGLPSPVHLLLVAAFPLVAGLLGAAAVRGADRDRAGAR